MRISPKYFKFFLFIISIQAQSQQNGLIILTDSSSIPVKILKNSPSSSPSLIYYFDMVKIASSDSSKVYFPHEIKGYTIGKKIYKSIKIKSGNTIRYVFGQQLVIGQATLYYYNGNVFDIKEVYIFNKRDDAQYYISLETRLKGENQGYNATSTPMPADLNLSAQMNELIRNLSNANAFKSQFLRYFADCKEVTNKLKQDWYTSTDITSLFQDYNSCKK